jgi:hypothetical protein
MNKKILANTDGMVKHTSSFSASKSNNHNCGLFAATNSSSLLADIQLSSKTLSYTLFNINPGEKPQSLTEFLNIYSGQFSV